MSDNLKKLPDFLYVEEPHFFLKPAEYIGVDAAIWGARNYIRADVAKEREKKLIASSFRVGVNDGGHTTSASYSLNDIYKEAGLEELE